MDRQLTQTHCRTLPKTPRSLHPGNLSSGFANIIEVHSGSWNIFPITLNLSLSSKREERKEQTRKKEEKKTQKAIISDFEKNDKIEQASSGCRRKKGEASRRHEGDAKWKTDYNSVDTQVLKTFLLKPQEAQTQMFKSDYSRFITLKLSLGRGQKMKATIK